MTRTNARELAVRLVFAGEGSENFWDEEYYKTLSEEDSTFKQFPDEKQAEYIKTLVCLVNEHLQEIDETINRNSKAWSTGRISSTALAVLRVAVCEMLFMEDVPKASAINAAVEISKSFDEPETVSFVNGVLGSIARSL